jgi:hypothetical protein
MTSEEKSAVPISAPRGDDDKVRDQLARQAGIASSTMGQVMAVANANPDLLDEVRDGSKNW